MMKRARIIYNPTSGRELFKKSLPEVLQKLEQAGYEASCHATTGPGDATVAARQAADRKFDVVIAAGGDGTLNEVVNGLVGHEHRPKFGIIPVGTTNDFARAIGVPRSIEEAADIICEGKTVPLDLGRANDTYFINIAGGGRITELTYEVPSKLKTVLGQLAYYLKGIEMLPSLHPTYVEIEYDGKLLQEEITMFLITNTRSVGGFEKVAPYASINDGLFDLLVLKKGSIADLIKAATQAQRGEHINNPKVLYTQANRIKVHSPDKLMINLDGEYGGDAPMEFENIYHCLELFVPEHQEDAL
ncbi:diacylglycerol kinase [Bacillus tropicus]|jgi:diacylglycerol kinase (ATP)|uniref:Diacylglycerol kinase n=13 Tax=Bacillus cereus group TaxID=86661 RepID=A0A0F7RMR0_BACAN|nr:MULTISPECIES: diacylglycerol kinase [Bacillus]EEK86057.1 Diacylglycerol kinase [Bacillus cereus ATCC 4342]EEM24520.1 Diacylglycerol kinase [Bacillus thuringiensis serovar tochigiensis BGSC 4Y1]EJT21306.1 lipid kinase [Bacillus anthracis str. UR-1]OON70448.1 diacylglycerol kinase [Klebsiella pneumoniae]OTX90357.1 diacylglycerol kinase [Bacillus thuringiensis serovar chanpaisis]OTY60120.1 diacylglycerol kinase [Bacillus thuringiensis serovar graciosensis]CGG58083.1 diacylglycerol kinase cat